MNTASKKPHPFKKAEVVVILVLLLFCEGVTAQCTSTTLFPLTPVLASVFNDTMTVSNVSEAGQYYRVENLALNETYQFLSSGTGDYITIRDVYSNAVIDHGTPPLIYNTGNGPDLVDVHLNLLVPPCGTDTISRTTRIVCTSCPGIPGSVGIGNANPVATLDIGGELKIGDAIRPPEAGMVRWNEETKDFEGYNGIQWLSLTQSNGAPGSWGQISNMTMQENYHLIASDGATLDAFGDGVAISSEYCVIGARGDDIGMNDSQGSAYIYELSDSGWIQQIKLTASDGEEGDNFGYSVCISGDYVIIGAIGDQIGANFLQGSAYIFVRNGTTWTQQAKLTASDGAGGDEFGISVSISGDYAVVGAGSDDIGANLHQGSAYIFVRNGTAWTQQAKITSTDGATSDRFGSAVSIDGNSIIAGAAGHNVGSNDDQGSAYVFTRTGTVWTQQTILTASDGAAMDAFGSSVGIHGNSAIVGADSDDIGSNNAQGSAYFFARNGTAWSHQTKVNVVDGGANDRFGQSVGIFGEYAVVGASSDDVNYVNQGSAYLFMRSGTTWIQKAKFIASDGGNGDDYGDQIAITDDFIIIGAPNDDIGTQQIQGSVYILRKN